MFMHDVGAATPCAMRRQRDAQARAARRDDERHALRTLDVAAWLLRRRLHYQYRLICAG